MKLRIWYAVKRSVKSKFYQFFEPHADNERVIEDISPDGGNFEVVKLVDFRVLEEEITRRQKAEIIAQQLYRWRNAWANQDTSDSEPARKAMFKALDLYDNQYPNALKGE